MRNLLPDGLNTKGACFAAALLLLGLAPLAGCDVTEPVKPEPQQGNLRVLLTDAPFPFDLAEAANVTITRLTLHGSEGGPIVLLEQQRAFNLLDLQGGVTALLATQDDLREGDYGQVQLDVSAASVVFKDGRVFDLKVPSGSIKVLLDGFSIEEGKTATLTLDFDVEESFVVLGNPNTPAGIKGFLFKPVVKPLGWDYDPADDDGDGGDDDDNDEGDGDEEGNDNEDDSNDDEDQEELTLTGTIDEIGVGFLAVSDRRFEISDETDFNGVDSLVELSVGTKVEVTYAELEDGRLLALKIQVEENSDDDNDEEGED